jgi:alpha-1,3-rhamnosyl/mannosyltransferase
MIYTLDLRTATAHFPGIGRYVVNLARAMVPLLEEDERLILLRDPARPSPWDVTALAGERVEIVDVSCSPFSLRQQWAIPSILRRLRADLYHSPYYLMPYRPGVPTLLTVYDLIPLLFPEHVSRRARWLFRRTMSLALRSAAHVVAIPQNTRSDLQRVFSLRPEKTTFVPLAPDPAFFPRTPAEIAAIRRKYDLPETFVLYVGSNKPHKNLVRLVEAWSHLTQYEIRFTLVITGIWDPRYPQARQLAEARGLENVRWLGPVPEADLPALYSAAAVFVFPSLYEGFGLPVLEAMACGAPVACSDTSSLPEVVGDAALTFFPTDPYAIAGALSRLLQDADLRADLRERGLRQAARFSWRRTAEETLALYRHIVRASPA